MIVEQIKLSRMDTFCYILGNEQTKEAALIDPAFDVQRILDRVTTLGLKLTTLINTHHHGDHSAGNARVIQETGARLYIHQADGQRLNKLPSKMFSKFLGGKGSPPADVLLKDNDEIPLGSETINVLHTPGHTLGGICLYIPGHVFTGDTLFVGYVGITYLPGGSSTQLVTSIREKLYQLPDETIVWPGHDYGVSRRSTIADEKRTNPYT